MINRTAHNESARKLLSPNRDFYALQSAMTRGGRVPTTDEVMAAQYQREQIATAEPTEYAYEH